MDSNGKENMQEQIGSVSKHMEILRKKQKEMLQIKTKTLKEMKNIFDGLLSRLDAADKWISELKDIAKESLKTEKQRKQRLGEKIEYPRSNYKRYNTRVMLIPEGEEGSEQKKYLKH